MLFNSFIFLLVIPFVLAAYWGTIYITKQKGTELANVLLVIISYCFYIYNQPVYTLILFGVTVITYLFALAFTSRQASNSKARCRLLVMFSSVLILLPLLVFKYYNFVLSTFNEAFSFFNIKINVSHNSWIVPLGISFFTFQAIGYTLDVYHKRITAERNFIYYALFVCFFPQIASGPISKASELIPQFRAPRRFAHENLTQGFKWLLWGYFLKAVFADRLALYVNPVFDDFENFSGLTCFFASICYSFQIYGDFAGYSLMAIGVAKLLGFDLINNFNRPYFAVSVTDFWRRWHISLTRWLKEHIYISLGGNRKGKARTYFNIMLTFLVSGIWHGASFTFIIWGLMHGIAQCVEKFFGLNRSTSTNKFIVLCRIFMTFFIVNFAWVFFRSKTFHDGFLFIKRIFTFSPGASLSVKSTTLFLMLSAIFIVISVEICQEWKPSLSLISNKYRLVRWATITVLVFAILLFGVLDSSQFIYVNF